MAQSIPTVHYLNQFFAGLGGEDQADLAPCLFLGPKGPGVLIEQTAPQIRIVATIVAGDNYFAEQNDETLDRLLGLVEHQSNAGKIEPPKLLLSGPAFNAGRYGMACGAICQAVASRLKIPSATAMFPDNPAVDLYRRHVTIARCGENVMDMPTAVKRMTNVAMKLAANETIDADLDQIIPHGLRQNYFANLTGAERAISMLVSKMNDEPFQTEYEMPNFDRVSPAPAVIDLSQSRIALVTSGGIVPRGNPDRIPSASAKHYGEYRLDGIDKLTPESHQTVHGGYDPTFANSDPHRVLPVDVLRSLEKAGRIKELYPAYYSTVGNATSVSQAKRFGSEIAAKLVDAQVQAVILTST